MLLSQEETPSPNPFAASSASKPDADTPSRRPTSPAPVQPPPPIEAPVKQWQLLPGATVSLDDKKAMLRELSASINAASRATTTPSEFRQLDPVAFLVWLFGSFTNKKLFLRLLIDDNRQLALRRASSRSSSSSSSLLSLSLSPSSSSSTLTSSGQTVQHGGCLLLWIQLCMAQGRYDLVFDVYEELGSVYDAGMMLVAAAHRKRTAFEREAALRQVLPYLVRNNLAWQQKQVREEIELLRRQREILAYQQHHGAAKIFADFPPPAELQSCELTLYEALIYLWTYHQHASGGDLSPVDFEKQFAVSTPRKAMATLVARARLHDWTSVRKIADQSTSLGSRLLGVLSGNQRVIAENNLEVFVAQVFANKGPVELMIYFASRIPDSHLRFDVALRYRLWDVAIGAARTPEQAMLLLTRLSKQPDENQPWIEKVVALLKTFRAK